eukprot:11331748-Alexandrium_andersonii.AAC.1
MSGDEACQVRWAWPSGGTRPTRKSGGRRARVNEDRHEAPAQQLRPRPRPQPRATEGDAQATEVGGRPPPGGRPFSAISGTPGAAEY